MTKDIDPPSIDNLLKASNLEERLAEARARREKVLAARAQAVPVAPDKRSTLRPPPFFSSYPINGMGKRPALALSIAAMLVIGMVVGGIAGWLLPAGSNTDTVENKTQTEARAPKDPAIQPASDRQTESTAAASSENAQDMASIQPLPDLPVMLPAPTHRSQPAEPVLGQNPDMALPDVTHSGHRPFAETESFILPAPGAEMESLRLPGLHMEFAQTAQPARPISLWVDTSPTQQSEPISGRPDIRIFVSGNTTRNTQEKITAILQEGGLILPEAISLPFGSPETDVRFYHADDAQIARSIAGPLGVQARDFTQYSPAPPDGTIDIYLGN